MTTERIKEIQSETAYPDSVSVQQALIKVWNECEQECKGNVNRNINDESAPKYEYHVYTWGGFYNEEFYKIHKRPRGDFWFDTEEERQEFIEDLRVIEKELNARHLAIYLSEGYCCRIETVLHRVIEWKGQRHYSSYRMGINYPLDVAEYHLNHKWQPGFNDYPLGENFDYDKNKIKVIQEWITGAKQNMSVD